MKRAVPLYWVMWAFVASGQAFAADLIVDGTSQTLSVSTPKTFDSIRIINGGILTISGMDYIQSDTFEVDGRSTVRVGQTEWPDYSRNGTGTGGSNAGRGSGPNPHYSFGAISWYTPLENAHRRVDAFYPGQDGGTGPDETYYGPHGCSFTIHGGSKGLGTWIIAIRAEKIVVQGKVLSNGGDSPRETEIPSINCGFGYEFPRGGGGGGAGGSVYLISRDLIIGPSAVIQANGGNGGNNPGYAGGGGRVKIYYESGIIDPLAIVEAKGGQNYGHGLLYGPTAEDGTVFIKQVNNIDHLFNPSADVNSDGRIDEKDLLLLMSQWKTVEPTQTPRPTPVILATPTVTPGP